VIVDWLPPRISADLSLVSGFLTWIIILAWLWRSGWKVQRRYLVEATQTPLTRNAIVWCAGIFGAFFFVGAQMRPGIPAVMTVAMIGALSAYVDARTHRLPNKYTAVMGIGVVVGALIGSLISPMWEQRLIGFVLGALIWTIPIALLNRLPGGMGGGDVKLAPVLGAMVGSVGLNAAVFALALSFVSAGVAALWKIVVGWAGTQSRVPMGPWMIASALVGTIAWGVVPDWL
jgi:peptidase, A24 family